METGSKGQATPSHRDENITTPYTFINSGSRPKKSRKKREIIEIRVSKMSSIRHGR